MIRPLTSFDSNRGPTYKTHNPTTPGDGIVIVTPSPHISPIDPRTNKVNVNVGKDICLNLYPYAWTLPENFPPAKVEKNLGMGTGGKLRVEQVLPYSKPCDPFDHPEDNDAGEPDPGFPPEDI